MLGPSRVAKVSRVIPSHDAARPSQRQDRSQRRPAEKSLVTPPRAGVKRPERRRGSEDADVRRLWALLTLLDVELDPLVLLQAAEPARRDGREVGEHIGAAIVLGDEPEALVRVEPFYRANSHVCLLTQG